MLSANAEKHANNPDFRADMLVTLRNSTEKLDALLARLGRYGSGQGQNVGDVDLSALVKHVTERFSSAHPITFTPAQSIKVRADSESLEQALIHLIQNAIDASESDDRVFVDVSNDGLTGRIEIIDSGAGMTPEFIRNGLFKPFVSSKHGGFGIGAFEAREMIKAMGGRLTVESREDVGTRFCVALPLPEAVKLLEQRNDPTHQEVA